MVSQVVKGGNADAAGIMAGNQAARYGTSIIYLGGDVITKIDNIAVSSIADYFSALESKRPGEFVNLTVRRNGKDLAIQVRLADPSSTGKSERATNKIYGI